MPRQRQNSFTLIEMLAVLVIIAIILSIGILSVTRIGQSMKLQTAGSNLVNTMNMARQYAILHHTTTAIVFSTYYQSPAGYQDLSIGTNIAPPFTSYAVATYDGNRHTTWTINPPSFPNVGTLDYAQTCFEIKYITRWKQLPKGIVFDYSNWPGQAFRPQTYPTDCTFLPENFRKAYSLYANYVGPIVVPVNFPTNYTPTSCQQASLEALMYFSFDRASQTSINLREGYYDPSQGVRVYTQGGVFSGQAALPVTNANVNCFNVYLSNLGQVVVRRK